MTFGYHHWHKRHRTNHHPSDKIHSAKTKKLLDDLVYVSAVAGVISYIPQLLTIWRERSVAGVSLASWVMFFLSSLFWIVYGYVHRSKPIMILNVSLAVVQLLIVIGILTH